MIRYLMHKISGHRGWMPGRGYAYFYYCQTCGKGWNGLVYRAGRFWAS